LHKKNSRAKRDVLFL